MDELLEKEILIKCTSNNPMRSGSLCRVCEQQLSPSQSSSFFKIGFCNEP
jgi:ribosomal protein L40E